MKLWTAKRLMFTGVSMAVSALLLWLLVEVLSQDGVTQQMLALMVIFVTVCNGIMILGLGEAATQMELQRREANLPQSWSRSANDTGCLLCYEKQTFLRCKNHNANLCWPCGYRHNQNNPECVLIPFGTPELVK